MKIENFTVLHSYVFSQLPSAKIWVQASTIIYNAVMVDPVDPKLKQVNI
jgi:hypothetical protein